MSLRNVHRFSKNKCNDSRKLFSTIIWSYFIM